MCWDRPYIACVPGPRQPPLPRATRHAPGGSPRPCKPAVSLTLPRGTGERPPLRCLLGAVLAGRPAPLAAWAVTVPSAWLGTGAHLTCTPQIKLLPAAFDLLLCDKQHGMLLHPARFPGGMCAGNCSVAVGAGCVRLLAADDAIAPMCDTGGMCMSPPGRPVCPVQWKPGQAVLPVPPQPAAVTARGPRLLDGCFLFSRLASKSQPKQKRREDIGPKKR